MSQHNLDQTCWAEHEAPDNSDNRKGKNDGNVESILDDIIKKYRKDLILDEKLLLPLMNFKKKSKIALWS